jgi:hypothetical protein
MTKGKAMAQSSLMHTGEEPPSVRKGHGTAELGPTDSTDSGSDVRGGFGFEHEERLGLTPDQGGERGGEGIVEGAGPDIGDRDLDSDSDRTGTGERASAGRDTAAAVDQILYDEAGNPVDGEDLVDDSELDVTLQAEEDDAAASEGDTAATSRRSGGSDVERDVPAFDRAQRDPSV